MKSTTILWCLLVVTVVQISQQMSLSIPLKAEEPDAKLSTKVVDTPPLTVSEEEMKPYSLKIKHTNVVFDMVPIVGGTFMMGSPIGEDKRKKDEGPQHLVRVEPFWMGKHEVTWNEFDTFRRCIDKKNREKEGVKASELEVIADGVTRPTVEYMPMDFKMGIDAKPAINMTQLAAKMYCEWLSKKTGVYHRLPTEAEWEYACRAGTNTAFHFGDDPSKLVEYAWFYSNSDEKYHTIGTKMPNPWGLYDMHGNVSEWCVDYYEADFYQKFDPQVAVDFPVAIPKSEYPRVVRGGSWDDDADRCRSAARNMSDESWKMQDADAPKSMWWLTDASMIGFRVIRPLKQPTEEEIKKNVFYPDIYEELKKERAFNYCN